MSAGVSVRRIPASPGVLITVRHETIVSALRIDRTPVNELPSIYRLARAVVRQGGYLELTVQGG